MRAAVLFALPIACVWARQKEALILRKGVALSAGQARGAGRIGVVHPERVRLLAVDVVPPINWILRGIGMRLGFVSPQIAGMTLRYGIFVRKDHWGDERLLVHELAHVAQYERLGGFRGFLGPYLSECINPGYPLGPLEEEARHAELLWFDRGA